MIDLFIAQQTTVPIFISRLTVILYWYWDENRRQKIAFYDAFLSGIRQMT